MSVAALYERPLRWAARWWQSWAEHAGQLGLLVWATFSAAARLRVSFREFVRQLQIMGMQSMPIVMITAILTGIVTSQQGGYQLTSTVPLYVVGSITVTSVVLELGPVPHGRRAGRQGGRAPSPPKLGTMVVSEQIDAYRSLGRDPLIILGAPRILAGLVVMPALAGLANLIGTISGMISAQMSLDIGYETFLFGARLFWQSWDIFYSFMKAITFGFAIPVIAIHMGFRTRGGAEGVGRTTTDSVMFQLLTIFILDAMFPPLFLQ